MFVVRGSAHPWRSQSYFPLVGLQSCLLPCATAMLEQERGVMPTPLASQTWQNLVIIETASYSPLLDLEAIKPKNQLDL